MKTTTYLLAVITLFPVAQHLFAQSTDTDHIPEVNRKYQLLREDEDWSFLKDSKLREDFWDPIKYIPLRRSADDWYMTMGEIGRAHV